MSWDQFVYTWLSPLASLYTWPLPWGAGARAQARSQARSRVCVARTRSGGRKREKNIGSSGMWRLRMRGLNILVYRPSKTEGVGTPHLKLIWARGFENSTLRPHVLTHHIPKHPKREEARVILYYII